MGDHGPTNSVPEIRLGRREPNSVAPVVYALVERGCMKRPELVTGLLCRAELRLSDGYPPVRLTFTNAAIDVEDAPASDLSADPPGRSGTLDELQAEGDATEAALDPVPDSGVRTARFDPHVVVEGTLSDIIALMATPTYRGLPNLTHPHGRSAVATIAARRVRFRGNLLRARQLIRLLQI
jgi:hypothetical protein